MWLSFYLFDTHPYPPPLTLLPLFFTLNISPFFLPLSVSLLFSITAWYLFSFYYPFFLSSSIFSSLFPFTSSPFLPTHSYSSLFPFYAPSFILISSFPSPSVLFLPLRLHLILFSFLLLFPRYMSFLILLSAHVYVSLFVCHCLCLLLSHSPPVLPTIHFHLINRHSHPLLSLPSLPCVTFPSRPAESFKTRAISVLSLYSIPPSNTQKNSLVCLSICLFFSPSFPFFPTKLTTPTSSTSTTTAASIISLLFLQSRLVPCLSFIRRPITIAIV